MKDRLSSADAMRRLATGLLVLLTLTYLATFAFDASMSTDFLRTAAGAGIVGALADWFAIVAIFRHPLGLPVPHTALVQKNQTDIAKNIGRFIEDHFLDPDMIASRINEVGVTARLSNWAIGSDAASRLSDRITYVASLALNSGLVPSLSPAIVDITRRTARKATQSERLALEASAFLTGAVKGDGLTRLLSYICEAIDNNPDVAIRLVTSRSRWWIHKRVDKTTARALVAGVSSVLNDLRKPEGELRRSLEATLVQVITDVTRNGTLSDVLSQSAEQYLDSDEFSDLIADLLTKFSSTSDLRENNLFRVAVEDLVQRSIHAISNDPVLQAELDRGLSKFLTEAVTFLRPFIGRFVTETIMSWDPDTLVERIENETGRDLQFIRINGSILGFLIGGVLFAVEHVIA